MSTPALRTLAPAKVNLGLFVGPIREDGRHELVSVMQSITLADEVSLAPAPAGAVADEVDCTGVQGPNLALDALTRFRQETGWDAAPQRVTIVKRVPVAAGLGGGSGDAAAVLRLAAAASGLGSPPLLARIAAGLGADVPAQLQPGRWLAAGAGERLTPLPAPREPLHLLVLPAPEGLSTAAVYREFDRLGALRSLPALAGLHGELRDALSAGAALPQGRLLANDLQDAAVSLRPDVGATLARIDAQARADAALVSGSGPTVLVLFAGADADERMRGAMRALRECEPIAAAALTSPSKDD